MARCTIPISESLHLLSLRSSTCFANSSSNHPRMCRLLGTKWGLWVYKRCDTQGVHSLWGGEAGFISKANRDCALPCKIQYELVDEHSCNYSVNLASEV